MIRVFRNVVLLLAVLSLGGCQSPTSASDKPGVDDYIITSINPDPAVAQASHGRTYRVVRGNNQPDEILEFDWETTFTISVMLNDRTDDEDVGFAFPIDITAANAKVQQASGGIVTPPTGGEIEHWDSIITQSSASRFGSANATITMSFNVAYDLPNLRKEALVAVALTMVDKNGKSTGKTVNVRVSP